MWWSMRSIIVVIVEEGYVKVRGGELHACITPRQLLSRPGEYVAARNVCDVGA